MILWKLLAFAPEETDRSNVSIYNNIKIIDEEKRYHNLKCTFSRDRAFEAKKSLFKGIYTVNNSFLL